MVNLGTGHRLSRFYDTYVLIMYNEIQRSLYLLAVKGAQDPASEEAGHSARLRARAGRAQGRQAPAWPAVLSDAETGGPRREQAGQPGRQGGPHMGV